MRYLYPIDYKNTLAQDKMINKDAIRLLEEEANPIYDSQVDLVFQRLFILDENLEQTPAEFLQEHGG